MRKDILDKIEKAKKNKEVLYSFSRLDVANDCLYAYNETYNKSNKGIGNVYASLGLAIHDGLEEFYNTGKNNLSKKFEEEYNKTKEDGYNFMSDTIEESYMYCMRHYIENFKSDNKNSLQEFPFMIEYKGKKIIGYIDRIVQDTSNEGERTLRIIDYKTSTMYTKSDKKIKGRQLVLYAYAIEQMTGYKVTSVCWDMLKYVKITYKGKTRKTKKFFLRNEYVLAWKNEILQELENKGYDFEEALDIYMECLGKNKMPEEVLDMFEFEDALVEYEYNEETKEELFNYLDTTFDMLLNVKNWKTKHIKDKNFKCFYLCNHRETCPALKSYFNNIPEHMLDDDGINFEELF